MLVFKWIKHLGRQPNVNIDIVLLILTLDNGQSYKDIISYMSNTLTFFGWLQFERDHFLCILILYTVYITMTQHLPKELSLALEGLLTVFLNHLPFRNPRQIFSL